MAYVSETERRLWIAFGGSGAVLIGLTFLFSAWFPRNGALVGGAFVGLMAIASRPDQRRTFLALPKARRALFILAVGALFIFVIVLANRREPAPLLFDIAEIVIFAALLLLYAIFSKVMDALWLRFTRR
ncbi:MAG: hypothetical protein WA294_08650 [Acidobacteriaceae bacterium]